jgi:hypothetical protein
VLLYCSELPGARLPFQEYAPIFPQGKPVVVLLRTRKVLFAFTKMPPKHFHRVRPTQVIQLGQHFHVRNSCVCCVLLFYSESAWSTLPLQTCAQICSQGGPYSCDLTCFTFPVFEIAVTCCVIHSKSQSPVCICKIRPVVIGG